MSTDDGRIRRALELAREQGLEVTITEGEIDGAHPNTARVTLTDARGRTVSLLASSIGGGNILVTEVNGMGVSITGQYTTLIVLHRDAPGTIAAVTEVMADAGVNICNFRLSRQQRGGQAVMTIEIDGSFGPELNETIKTLPISSPAPCFSRFKDSLLNERSESPLHLPLGLRFRECILLPGGFQMELDFNYSSVASFVTAAEKAGVPISALILKQQAEQMELPEEEVYEHMRANYQVMRECIEPGCHKDLRSTSGLTGGSAHKMQQVSLAGKSLTGPLLSGALYRALAVSELNASMGRIVAAPTAGSCGIIPAALLTMEEDRHCSERDCVMALFTASAVGMVIANNASLAGAQGGCQAECGSAAAMAAAAIVELAGGTPRLRSMQSPSQSRMYWDLCATLWPDLWKFPASSGTPPA